MIKCEQIKEDAKQLRLFNVAKYAEEIIRNAQVDKPTYLEFMSSILGLEIDNRGKKDYERRLMAARLPQKHDLDNYDFNFSESIGRQEMKQLRELMWIRQAYNIILMGPSGTGKTFIASGLVFDAVKAGYKAYMMNMESIITCLKMKEISASAMLTYNKILRANLLVIDDIMLFPVKKEDAVSFFNLISQLHEKASIIITTNKAPTEWVETLNDEVLAAALLDRLLFRCEVVKLTGASYRLENRQTIFSNLANREEENIS